jgi:hypothetical protein
MQHGLADEIVRVDDPTGQFGGPTGSGYVAVYDDGVVACSQNTDNTRPDNGEPLAGFIWVGPNHAAADITFAAPGNAAGVGNNTAADDPATEENEAHGPCD